MSLNISSSLSSKTTCTKREIHGPEAPFYRWLALGYGVLFILALTANLRVLFKLFHYSRRRFRDHILLLNLCAADLFVTLVYIPSEIYTYTIARWHNDGICKTLAALKGLGIYVSSCTIIGISLDRYLSIVHPLTVYQSNIRNKLFVVGSWLISAIACIPQLIIFKRLTNEDICREMCGDTLSSDPGKRLAYNIAVALFAYIAPLLTIFYSYFRILYVLHKRSDRRTFRFVRSSSNRNSCDLNQINLPLTSTRKSFTHERTTNGPSVVQEEINSHNIKTITRAKLKTLKLTALIVICFILCWTPYYCIVFFLLITDARIDSESAQTIVIDSLNSQQPTNNERSLLIVMMLAVSNSVLDPLIYGCFMVRTIPTNCCDRLRNRRETTTTSKRTANQLASDKESKLTTLRSHIKNGNLQREAIAECQL
ncbi:hypothetical protein I4U23_000525 [Adineta vaga]|nr:hypothetical protein I4U23_000525 [Adineta vaga]